LSRAVLLEIRVFASFPAVLARSGLLFPGSWSALQPGVPEVREYMLRGVIDDVEIGLDSDIQSITWGGN
jgi:hypothetical protein